MNSVPEDSFGGRLYAEMRKLSGYDIVTQKFSYEAIQQLKSADRAQTLRLFARSTPEVLNRLKTQEPEVVARFIVEEFRRSEALGLTAMIVLAAV